MLQLNEAEMDSFIELSCDNTLKQKSDNIFQINFWLGLQERYSRLYEKAVLFLMLLLQLITAKLNSLLCFP